MYSVVTIRSNNLDNTGVIEIGRKSDELTGALTFGRGLMEALFHCFGTTDMSSDRFIRSATGAAKRGAPTCRNHDGRLSKPVAVGRSLSRMLKI